MKDRDLSRQRRRDQMIHERIHDPYKARQKRPDPSLCPQCGALYQDGRWQWPKIKSDEAVSDLCPACHRINDKYPAGELTLTGRYLGTHRDEILALARHHEKLENEEHPLNRIMAIEEKPDQILITTTDIHLPHRIAHALHQAHHGVMNEHYDEEGYFARVTWHRED